MRKPRGAPPFHTRPLHTHSSGLPILSRRHERSAASVVSGVHLGLMLQQHPEPRDVVREGSGVKRGPVGRGSGQGETGKALSLLSSKREPEATQASPQASRHSPSFGISAVHNLGTQSSQQHLCGAVLVINSGGRGRVSKRGRGNRPPVLSPGHRPLSGAEV